MVTAISIIGAGGSGRELKNLIDEVNGHRKTWDLLGYFDDNLLAGTRVNGIPVLGTVNDALGDKFKNFGIAIGKPKIVKEISSRLLSAGKILPNIIHPTASLGNAHLNRIGCGNIFGFGFYMTVNITIGDFNFFNTRVTVGHDVKIGSCNVFLPNTQISGNVSIGDCNLFGMNSGVLQTKLIGSRNTVGAHSLVVSDIASDRSVFGVPAKNI